MPQPPPGCSPRPPSRPRSSPAPPTPTPRSASSSAPPPSRAATWCRTTAGAPPPSSASTSPRTGFSITSQQGSNPTNGAPVSYPSVYYGCHYTNCSPGTNLPMQVSRISSAHQQHQLPVRERRDLRRGLRHLARPDAQDRRRQPAGGHDLVQPAGLDPADRLGRRQRRPSAAAAGRSGGAATAPTTSSRTSRPSAISSWSFSVLDFLNDVKSRGAITTSWYLTSIQAGFEPWQGGAGLGVTSFSAAVNGGGDHADHRRRRPADARHRRQRRLPGHLQDQHLEHRLHRRRHGGQHRQRARSTAGRSPGRSPATSRSPTRGTPRSASPARR